MKAYDAFKLTLARAQSLVDLHEKSFPKGRPPESGEPPDLLRAAVVFAVAALDSYMHDKIAENVVRIVSCCGRKGGGFPGNLLEALKSGLSLEKSLVLIYRKRPDHEIKRIMEQYLSERTFQDPGKIEAALKYIGLSDLWEPLRLRLHLTSKEKCRKFLVHYVKRRHCIVHEGDVYKSKKHHHKLKAISRPYARNCVNDVKRFVQELDAVIDAHLKKDYPI